MSLNIQTKKADLFRKQHRDKKLLVLPNIWDPLSAKLVAALGFPSLATASIATAISNGYQDGEKIPFAKLLKVVKQITDAVSVPVSVDMERGFARTLPQLRKNVALLIENGAIGINIEDGKPDGRGLTSPEEHCRKIEAIKETGIKLGVAIVINARTDIFLQKHHEDILPMAAARANVYREAGADCFFPVLINDFASIAHLVQEAQMPVNVLLTEPINDLQKLESLGVARVSVGPGLLKHSLSAMKKEAEGLLNYRSEEFFRPDMVSGKLLEQLI